MSLHVGVSLTLLKARRLEARCATVRWVDRAYTKVSSA